MTSGTTAKVGGTSSKLPTVRQSGTSNIPLLSRHPGFIPFDSCKSLDNVLCYVMTHYGYDGVSYLINTAQQETTITVGDWRGNVIDLAQTSPQANSACRLLHFHGDWLIQLIRSVGIKSAQLYFGTDFTLVDVRTAINGWAGPGMVRDVFGKRFNTPEVRKITQLDDKTIAAINDGFDNFSGDLVIKPSRHRELEQNGSYRPLFLEVKRC